MLAYKTAPDRPAQLTFTLAGLLCQANDPSGSDNPHLVRLLPNAVMLASGEVFDRAD